MPSIQLSLFGGVSLSALIVFGLLWTIFRYRTRGAGPFYFDPQDCFDAQIKGRVLPKSASSATFEPMLKHYIGVMQLIVTVSAASIAFGGGNQAVPLIKIAKLFVTWSIAYGVAFCAILLWRYDEYTQNMRSYTPAWYTTVVALGFSSFSCFIVGYLVWGWGLI